MDARVLHILEFDKILNKLEGFTVSDTGREAVRALVPSADAGEVRTLLRQTEEADSIYRRSGQNPVESFPDARPILRRMHAALSLSARDLLSVARCMRTSRLVRERLLENEAAGLLRHMAGLLCSHRSVEEEIARCILSEEEISDAASPELAGIRRQRRIVNERARDKLNNMVKSTTFQKYLQEPIITIRNGRFVLPVKQEARQYVPGLIHDQSGSGATLFIEPMAVVELGNEHNRLLAAEQEEIERVLAGLTALAEPYADDLYESIGILGEIDLIFAKAIMGREIRAVCPELHEEKQIKIVSGRHPLIPAARVVPVDVWLGEDFSTLIITGPNTGGKTVTLKTIGLFSLMAQAGLFVPADVGTKLCTFSKIFADIGDEQSIEQSLSTFSSHMKTIVTILEEADDQSLVLLDELGAGTDPVEGAALAMSILLSLHERNALCAATTHYSEIKAFALTNAGMENASMEFDVDKLLPTYRLFVGIPGKSNAFEIASRLGLKDELIARARGFLRQEDVNFEDVIQSAQTQRQRAEQEREQAQELRYELERLRTAVEQEKKRLETEKAALRTKAREEARVIVREAREEMEQLITKLRNTKGLDMRAVEREVQQARDAARRREESLIDPLSLPETSGMPPQALRPGDRVRVLSLGQNATVQKAPNAKGEVQVQAGIIKVNVPITDLRMIEETVKPRAGAGVKLDPLHEVAGLSLDVRGKLVDEALIEVDRYIDDALLRGRMEVQIIHGKGTGALRKGIQDYLKRHKHVEACRLGNYGEGDAGVTIVTLK
ncbi:endonuclease MutS2 [Christensenellaceae bacterium OttesenSCG-928-L17]|nr:endonuclease MutS2 [Christensenellaceae bacterium OttesenSCG-928-L17]